MASGKQTSFQFGEVSPSLRFRSDAVSYSSGLSKLKNMYVRRAGGVSNRAGFEQIGVSEFQQDIPVQGGDPGVRGFTFWDANAKEWRSYEYGKIYNSTYDRYEYGFLITSPSAGKLYFFAGTSTNDRQFLGPLPKEIALTASKNGLFIAPAATIEVKPDEVTPSYISKYNVVLKNNTSSVSNYIPNFSFIIPFPYTLQFGFSFVNVASVPYGPGAISIPATYLFTGISSEDETEIRIARVDPGPVTLSIPNAQVTTFFKFNLTSPSGLKRIKIYRAAFRENDTTPFYKFVGQIIVNDTSTQYSFTDYGAEDAGQTPPFDDSAFDVSFLNGANAFAYYQQRIIAAMEPNITKTIKSGDMLASKIGVPLEFSAPLIYTSTGAFQFSIPITDGSPVVAMLPMERLIAFTERGVYAIRGGEQGVLTPTTINPLLISEDGCSKVVQPKMAGFKGYFINNTHTKLMYIVFGDDGNLRVGEASVFSDHTLLEDVVQLEVLAGGEDTVYLLRRDGKLVQVTVTEEGAHGFSVLDTNGYVESIFRGKAKKPYVRNQVSETEKNRYYDVLMCHVIRNGTRYLERINVRDHHNREGELFSDCAVSFGYRLADNGSNGYVRIGEGTTNAAKINIMPSFSWEAGAQIKIRSNAQLWNVLAWNVIHFFYGDNQYLRYMLDVSSQQTVVDPNGLIYEYTGYFTSDVPESLQNAVEQSISQAEKNKLLTRWLPAFKILIGTESFPELTSSKLFHLWNAINSDGLDEGSYKVAVSADGEVISSPLNPFMPSIDLTRVKVIAGELVTYYTQIELPDYFSYGHIGIPYTCEFETLDLEAGGGRTITDAKKLINAVGLGLMETRGGFAGIPEQTLENMTPIVTREDESFNNQTKNFNGHIVVHIPSEWNEPGRATIKHVDPSPISILSVYPKGIAGD